MFDKKYFKINKVYTINGYDYFIMDGGLSWGEAFEPVIDEINGKKVLSYRPVDKFQFTDGTYENISSMTLQEYLIKVGSYRTDFDNPFTRTIKVMKKIEGINSWKEVERPFNLRISKKALQELEDMKYNMPKCKVKK